MPIIQDLSKYTTSDYVAKYVSDALSASSGPSYNKYLPTWLFTSSGKWSVPLDGTYMVICIGKGGDGGSGSSTGDTTRWCAAPGSGGGGAGVGIYIGAFSAKSSQTITISDTKTCFNTNWIIANCGKNGTDGTREYYNSASSISIAGGAGGTVSGSHVTASYPGIAGETVTSYAFNSSVLGGKGGSAGIILAYPGINGTAGIGVLPGACTNGTDGRAKNNGNSYTSKGGAGGMFGAGGSGGGAAGACVDYPSDTAEVNATGGKGGQAAVLIQFLDAK